MMDDDQAGGMANVRKWRGVPLPSAVRLASPESVTGICHARLTALGKDSHSGDGAGVGLLCPNSKRRPTIIFKIK
jgi:hypothetical protein